MKSLALVCLIPALVAGNAFSSESASLVNSTISVIGTSTLKFAPDQITIPLTISTEDADLSKAKVLNDKKVKKVFNLAQEYGAAKEDIKTIYHSIEPQMSSGNDVELEIDVFSTNISYVIEVEGMAQEKVDALLESLQKLDLKNIDFTKTKGYEGITAHFNASHEKQKVVREKVVANQKAVIKVTTAAGIAADKVAINSTSGKGKEKHSQPFKQYIEKYKALIVLSVVLSDKDKAVEFVNASLKAGIDTVGSMMFSLKNEKAIQDKAALEALKDAKRKAQAIAEAVGMQIDRPLTISDSGSQVAPVQPYAMVSMARMKTNAFADGAMAENNPLPTGQIEINGDVRVTFLIKQK